MWLVNTFYTIDLQILEVTNTSPLRTLSIIYTQNTLFDNIYVNSTSTHASSRNTDGADTIYSSHITFRNWEVDNGDDNISIKANSTDILIEDSLFHRGLGIAIGSIGQYKDAYETVQRVRVRNITYSKTLHAVYFKTWTGEQVNYPPNGGGGGLGGMFEAIPCDMSDGGGGAC
jgi:polygalacturonase